MAAGNGSSVPIWKAAATAPPHFAYGLPKRAREACGPALCRPGHVDSRSRLPQLAPETQELKRGGAEEPLVSASPLGAPSVPLLCHHSSIYLIFRKPPEQTSVLTCAHQHTCTKVIQV